MGPWPVFRGTGQGPMLPLAAAAGGAKLSTVGPILAEIKGSVFHTGAVKGRTFRPGHDMLNLAAVSPYRSSHAMQRR